MCTNTRTRAQRWPPICDIVLLKLIYLYISIEILHKQLSRRRVPFALCIQLESYNVMRWLSVEVSFFLFAPGLGVSSTRDVRLIRMISRRQLLRVREIPLVDGIYTTRNSLPFSANKLELVMPAEDTQKTYSKCELHTCGRLAVMTEKNDMKRIACMRRNNCEAKPKSVVFMFGSAMSRYIYI